MSSPYDTATATCPYCNTPGCEADWCDVGVGLIQSGPYVCPNPNCGATSVGTYDENPLSEEEKKTGWHKPGKIGTSVNTFHGRPVGHKLAKALYRDGLLDEKD